MDGKALYELRLKKSGRTPELAHELELEDRYAAGTQKFLRSIGVPEEVLDIYRGWRAFCGGGSEAQEVIRRAADSVYEAQFSTGAQVPSYYCGLWPDPSFNAASLRTAHGNTIYFNTGLFVALRCLTQEVAFAFEEMAKGNIGERSTEVSSAIGAMFARYLSKVDIRRDYSIRWLTGPAEILRREMMWGALCYVIAHEAGHLAVCRPWQGGWAPDNAEFQVWAHLDETGNLIFPGTEQDSVNAHSAEMIADMTAATIIKEPPAPPGGEVTRGFLIGAMSVPLLQAAAWWRRAALTDEPLGWIHPFPDLRAAGVGMLLGQSEATLDVLRSPHPEVGSCGTSELEDLATAFREWAEVVFALDQCRALVHEKGLAGRGLSPGALVAIYATDPAMPQQPSEVLASFRKNGQA